MKFEEVKYSVGLLVLILFLNSGCTEEERPKRFHAIGPSISGLDFNNQLSENDSINIIDNEFVYNGAGVAIGDLNNDGLDDIFFAGNQVDNRLYLNLGELEFDDISKTAQIGKPDSLLWSSGVSIVDINADGKNDIYICNTFYRDSVHRKNLLYINQGNNDQNVPLFQEMAEAYGLADVSYSSHAQFFDYDRDGDLDLFIGVNRIEGVDPTLFRPLEDDGTSMSKDRLYENRGNTGQGHPHFVEISEKAGIRYHGYSHSTVINDFNEDGWPDIYVANDFFSNDLLYINNQDGTFTNRARDMFKHFSLSSMGSDMADIDNNGQLELYTTEMQPYYNKRKKLFQGPSSYQKEIFTKKFDYEKQYTRNTLQISHGTNPETQLPVFGEIAMLADIKETDWSWAPLFADYDNDGWQDLFITNGFPKDVTDRDFGDFRSTSKQFISKEKLIAAIPQIKVPNFMFRNRGDYEFVDVTKDWGLDFPTYSNGAAYGDLDGDGDLDLVVNNINDKALLLENKTNELDQGNRYLRIKLKGPKNNLNAIGATVEIYGDSLRQKKSLLSGRGYLSQPETILHFGLGNRSNIDSLKINWPNGNEQMLGKVSADTVVTIPYSPHPIHSDKTNAPRQSPLFEEVSDRYGLDHFAGDHDFIDFNFQSTLPHKFSQYGPALSVGDINSDGLDDLFVGASRSFKEKWFIQQADNSFVQKEVAYKNSQELHEEDAGTLLFDADNDGDLDLYIARGSAQYPSGHEYYRDMLMINNGQGNFTYSKNSLPDMRTNSSAVKAADFDRDGDLDLFIGSRVLPFSYPKSDRSYILRNESSAGSPKFTDVTQEINPELEFPGLISDALWTDFNGDSWPDLILAGEWMPLRFFKNDSGKLVEVTETTGVDSYSGWWNSLAAADLDNDGDIDYIAGNVGENLNFKGSMDEPVRIYAKDLDNNGSIDPLISYYLRDSVGIKKEYLYHPWQDVTKQYVGIRKRFNSFGEFGEATLPEMFPDGLLDDATVDSLNYMKTSWVENLGDGTFKMHALPIAAQLAPVYGILPQDLDGDGYLDLLMVGNDFGMEVQQGPADALVGVALRNKGDGSFESIPLNQSHFFVPGDGKSLVAISLSDTKRLIVASQNNDSLRVFEPKAKSDGVRILLQPDEVRSEIRFQNGQKQIREFYWGSSFQSQSSRIIRVPTKALEIRFYNIFGKETRKLDLQHVET
ncbi:FG-GAP-like repeat-containing protein [Pricia sp. S334]|uniref:FG-GAP-like repeat-containing protein n=1 Tax=Pricia mediterranea TaxID=3076079 RepID=A0ABU3L9J4_9FLAO|nr:FG-GAP-like repeat-containing protein [Pricia sp. S334]MDT7830162.1 FG-GAP-like repeat-containing protein [Pricia sp. S334]